jgi:hypothetical protein
VASNAAAACLGSEASGSVAAVLGASNRTRASPGGGETSNAITKLDARNRIDAIRIARQSGWI